MSLLKQLTNGFKAATRILVASDKFGEAVKIAREEAAGKAPPKRSAEPIQPYVPAVCHRCRGTLQIRYTDGTTENCPDCVKIEEPRR